jgi:hypothetical protein
MAKAKITLNVPSELLDSLKEFGVKNPITFLEDFFHEFDAEELVALMEDDGEDWEEDFDDEF